MRNLALILATLLVITVTSALAQTPIPTNRAGCETQTRTTVTSGIVGNISGASLRVLLLNCFSSFVTLSDTGQTIVNPIFTGLNGPVIANGSSPITAGTISGNTQAFVTADVAPIAGQCPQFDASGGLVPIVCPTGGGGSGGFTVGAAINGSCPNGQVVYSNSGIIGCEAVPGTGTVTSVGATVVGGIISVTGSPITASGNIAITIAGTIGGVPYFTSGAAWASSATLAANAIMIGGGTGSAPSTITTGLNVLTALGVNIGSAGAPVLFNGVGGTPVSLTLTNATGLPNAGLLNSSITLGTSSVALGGALTSVNGAIAWTGTPTFSNATYSALFTGGNVGFGTASPAELVNLSVSGTSDDNLLIDNTNQSTYSSLVTFRRLATSVWNVGVDFTASNAFKIATGASFNNFAAGTVFSITEAGLVDIPGKFVNPSLPGLAASVESSGVPGLDMPGCTTAATCAWYIYGGPTLASGAAGSSTLNINRSPTGTGGSGALNPAAVYVTTIIPAGDSYFEWGITSNFQNFATGSNNSQNVAIAGIANKMGTGIVGATFGANLSCQDQTGQANPTFGCVGAELDVSIINSSGTPVNGGPDPNHNRIVLAVDMQGASGTHVGYGISIGADTAGGVFDTGIKFNGIGSYGVGIDTTGVSFSGNVLNLTNFTVDGSGNTIIDGSVAIGSTSSTALEVAGTVTFGSSVVLSGLSAGSATTHLCLASNIIVTC